MEKDELKELVQNLNQIQENEKIQEKIQDILEYVLTKTQLLLKVNNKSMTIIPCEVEAYYYHKNNFRDQTVHKHILQKTSDTNNRFGKLYFHRYKRSRSEDYSPFLRSANRAGMDLCLSVDENAILSILIKTALIKEQKKKFSQAKLVQKVFEYFFGESYSVIRKRLSLEYKKQIYNKNTSKINEIEGLETDYALEKSNNEKVDCKIIKQQRKGINKEKYPEEAEYIFNCQKFGVY